MGWSAALYSPYNSTTESIFALDGTYRKRIDGTEIWEWGIDAPTVRPLVAVGEDTGLTGNYDAKYTYCRKEKSTLVCESNPSNAASAVVALSNESMKITAEAPDDEQVNCIRFYRTSANGSTYSLDRDLSYCNRDYSVCHQWEEDDAYFSGYAYRFTITNTKDNTEDCFTWEQYRKQYSGTDYNYKITSAGDNFLFIDTSIADASLGTTVATDHDRPPLGTYVAGPSFNGTLFIIKDHRLYFSKTKQPEYFPSTNFIDVGIVQYGGKCVVLYDKQPYYLTKNKIYFIYGSSSSDFIPKDMAAKTGTQSSNGALAVEGYGIFHVGGDGIYLFLPPSDSRFGSDEKISRPFDPIFRGESKNGIPAVGDLTNSWLVYWSDRVFFGYPGVGDTYPTNILVYYLDDKKIGYHSRGEEINAVTVDNYNNRLLAVDGDGYAWVIESEGVTGDDGEDISWEVESKAFTLQTRRHFPRWAKYDIDASGSGSANGYVMLDDDSHQTHTLTENRNTRRRLITPGNGRRLSHRISGTGPVEIYMVESE